MVNEIPGGDGLKDNHPLGIEWTVALTSYLIGAVTAYFNFNQSNARSTGYDQWLTRWFWSQVSFSRSHHTSQKVTAELGVRGDDTDQICWNFTIWNRVIKTERKSHVYVCVCACITYHKEYRIFYDISIILLFEHFNYAFPQPNSE